MNESVLDYRVLGDTRRRERRARRSACCSSSRRATRSTRTSAPARRPASGSTASTSRPSRSCAPSSSPARVVGGAEQAAVVVVSIGHESTTLVVSGDGVCEFTRVFGWGGAQLDAAIASACSVDGLEAAAIKTQLSLERRAAAGHRRGRGRKGAGGGAHGADALRPRARLLAPVLPEAAGFSGHRRDRRHRRHLAARGHGRRAAHARRRAGPHGRPARPRRGRPRRRRRTRRWPTRSARSRSRSAWASTTTRCGRSTCCRATSRPHGARRPSRTQILVPAAFAVPVVALGAMLLPAKSDVSNKESRARDAEGRAGDAAGAVRPRHRLEHQGRAGAPRRSRRRRALAPHGLGPRPPRPLARPARRTSG